MKEKARTCLTLLLGLSLLLNANPPAPAQSLEEQTVMAALALNIVRFTTWPKEAEANLDEAIDFCVIGDNVVQESFASIDSKPVGKQSLRVVYLTRLRNFEQCDVLYISELKQNILLQVFDQIKKQPLLTIGEGYDFVAQGGMVGLENVGGKITMHINMPVARESNFNFSIRLVKLAKIIGR